MLRWNLAKPGGWDSYKKETDKVSEKIDKLVEDETKDIDEVLDSFTKIHDKVKFVSFGKSTVSKKKEIN